MMDVSQNIHTGIAIKIYFATVILFLVLSIVVIYFHSSKPSNPTTGFNATTTQENTIISNAEKYQILNQLSQEATPTSVLTDNEKLKLLELLK